MAIHIPIAAKAIRKAGISLNRTKLALLLPRLAIKITGVVAARVKIRAQRTRLWFAP